MRPGETFPGPLWSVPVSTKGPNVSRILILSSDDLARVAEALRSGNDWETQTTDGEALIIREWQPDDTAA
jgi:hypothetical protein